MCEFLPEQPPTHEEVYDGWAFTIPETDALVLQSGPWWAAWRCQTTVILCNPADFGHGIVLARCPDAESAEELARAVAKRADRHLVCVEDPASCPICWEDLHLRQAVMRCCGRGRRHYFHFGCGQHWIEAAQDLGQTPSCPVCRNQLQVKKAKLEQLLTGGEDALEEHDLVGEWANECIPSHWEGMSLAEKTGYAAGLAAHAVLGFSQAVHAAVGLAQAKPRLPRVDVLA
ncbi:unnamed protein product [Effrenium voratum]|uniref:RING-type domain-containing protein n=1 Tax=Effrenium voratum TaxID=2562239 RepID=A0AA36ILM0_9DINO|nr:unnamed protein product [Effrenium voratum]CAJ1420869.1 unnamed protein product [Effrenium voratum]